MVVSKKSFTLIPILILYFELAECNFDVLDIPNGAVHEDYVDPHSFYYDRHTEKEVKSIPLETSYRKVDISSEQKCNKVFNDCLDGLSKDVSDDLFSRRLINMLLSLADFEENDRFFTSHIMIELTKPELKKLQNFGLGKGTIREIDSIVKHGFRTPKKNIFKDIADVVFNWPPSIPIENAYLSYFIQLFQWKNKEIIIVSIALASIIWLLSRPQRKYFSLIFTGIIIIFVASFFITYLQLLREAEIELTSKQFRYTELPAHCRTHELTFWQSITYIFKPVKSIDESCKKFHESMMENPFLKVTPSEALSVTLAKFSLQPISILGSAIGDFVENITKHMSPGIKFLVQPLLMISMTVAILVFVACLCGCSPSIGFGPLKLFTLNGRDSSRGSQSMTGKEKREPIEIIQKLRLPSNKSIPQLAVKALENENSSLMPSTSNQPSEQNEEFGSGTNTEGSILRKSDLSVGDTNLTSLSLVETELEEYVGYEIITTIRNSRLGDD